MTSPAIIPTTPATDSPLSTTKYRLYNISPGLFSDYSPTLQFTKHKKLNPLRSIKSSVSDSTAIINTPMPEFEENQVRIGGKVRITVPLTVYHIPKVTEVDLKGKEGKIKENVAVWKGHHISANFPCKIEFFEKLDGRGDNPVKFFAHLREDEFEYID